MVERSKLEAWTLLDGGEGGPLLWSVHKVVLTLLRGWEKRHLGDMMTPLATQNVYCRLLDMLKIGLKLIVHLNAWPEKGGGAIRDDG